jgi:hypothetical protein
MSGKSSFDDAAQRHHANIEPSANAQPPAAPVWQFSLRTLLVVTALVSVCLAIGVHFAGFMFALVVIGLIQITTLLSADWLIRPENRRALAFVTAGSWIVLGSGILIIGIREVFLGIGTDGDAGAWIFAWCLIVIGLGCYYIAAKRWRRLGRGMFSPQRDVNS